MFQGKVIQIRVETLGKLARNFPAIASSKLSDLTVNQINVVMMVDCANLCEIF